MNRRQHALLARRLIEANAGLTEAAKRCRVRKSQLSDYQNAHAASFMPADVIDALEGGCGQPIYSRALCEARSFAPKTDDLRDEACEAAERAVGFERGVRLALKDGRLTPAERDRLSRLHAEAEAELREAGQLLQHGAPH